MTSYIFAHLNLTTQHLSIFQYFKLLNDLVVHGLITVFSSVSADISDGGPGHTAQWTDRWHHRGFGGGDWIQSSCQGDFVYGNLGKHWPESSHSVNIPSIYSISVTLTPGNSYRVSVIASNLGGDRGSTLSNDVNIGNYKCKWFYKHWLFSKIFVQHELPDQATVYGVGNDPP